jgi:hypothetical protein
MCMRTSEGAVNETRVNLLCKGGSEWPALEELPDIKE